MSDSAMRVQPVILSGGSGTRLWPLSRAALPKQFLPLIGDQTLIQQTALRVDLPDQLAPMVVCNEDHRFLVAGQLHQVGLDARVLLEPVGRNTAPALTLAALAADSADVLVVMPADHAILDLDAFRGAVARAVRLAADGQVVTFGIMPSHPATGYGYIRSGEALPDGPGHVLAGFVEKPDAATAQSYLDSGEYFWNSGIFVMRAGRWLELLERFHPEMLKACRASMTKGTADMDFYRANAEEFAKCPADSIDYAVMEPASSADDVSCVVLPLDAGWSDIGAWDALWATRDKDEQQNAIHGDVVALDSAGNLVHADGRMVALLGVQDLMVVETQDAVLVAAKSKSQDVKAITDHLKAMQREECKFHKRVHRPWGSYECIDEGGRFQVKRLTVEPGATLSLQMHHHRAEHWVVVKGTARVTRDDEVFLLSENESTYIPLGAKHRLENPGNVPLEIIEVQSGSYLGEDDIVRFEDVYNRADEPAA